MATYLYPASQTPTPSLPTDFPTIASAASRPDSRAPVARSAEPNTLRISNVLNANAMIEDLLARYLSGVSAVVRGLQLVAPPSGRDLTVSAGHALITGTVELGADVTKTLNDSSTAYVWMLQNTLIYPVYGSAAPPAPSNGPAVFLGRVTTSGGNITAIDYSGVVYWAGTLWRRTGDLSTPTDAPSAGAALPGLALRTYTPYGAYEWDGTKHLPLWRYRASIFSPGKPANGGIALVHAVSDPFSAPQNLVGSIAVSDAPAAADAVFHIQLNGSPLGTLTFLAGESTGVFSSSSISTFARGDTIKVITPSPQDATLSDISIEILGG